jgi:hypothetical protein
MKELVIENFKLKVIDTVDYIDKETMLIKESVGMNEYNSIETGYNMKHSVDLQTYIKVLLFKLIYIFI